MQKRLVVLLALGGLVLGGCTSMKKEQSVVEYDLQKINAVNKAAFSSAVEVIWVNPPRKKAKNR